ncbi:EpsG family protein [Galbibacter pacificus]|uniref:EpsG family protein n=1 Tax=Galbibacter pacificus TaxID=2996052 RepID=A0ABT6FRV3_9FLAO|nr:EpsG family protein [Galbibacter pacificus]MDG3581737.1 EpsG family protein [Galbibacter pacificus]MDG3585789.1 EpsG family protein [Galbibacter pacificus]
MFDLFPIEKYGTVFYNMQAAVILLTVFHTQIMDYQDKKVQQYLGLIGWPYALFILFFIGLRPISGEFIDMTTYAYMFQREISGSPIDIGSDFGFGFLVKFSALVTTINGFFFICACIYILPLAVACRRFFKNYWIYCFIALVASFSFYAYGVNGIRNGMATSIFILGLSYHKKPIVSGLIVFLSCTFHQSMYLPTAAYVITFFLNFPKAYLIAWFAAIPLSLVFGSLFIMIFTSLGFADDRLSQYLLADVDKSAFSNTGFRWDFLLYSATGTFAGWYFIFKKKFTDKMYHRIYGTYLISNAFWILIITANFSNRFAYLSWFMLAVVIFYPFLKKRFFNYQHQVLGIVLLMYFLFTYLLNFVKPNL